MKKIVGFGIAGIVTMLVVLYTNSNHSTFATADAEQKAVLIYKRLTGTGIPLDSPVIQQMIPLIQQGKAKDAAKLVTDNAPGFYNIVVRDMFARMSARDELVTTRLTDFTATAIGTVRDNIDVRQLLTGNYYYKAAPGTLQSNGNAVTQDVAASIVRSNTHYNQIADLDLKAVLQKVDGQVLVPTGNSTTTVPQPDPAGLITTRQWMLAHAIAGTNRRNIEFAFQEFLCQPITAWMDSGNPDAYVGIDVDRFPEGNADTFKNKCNACHSGMDSLRPAFGKVNFSGTDDNGFAQHSSVSNTPAFADANGIANKLNPAANTNFPDGYRPRDTSFQNLSTRPANWEYFGWDSATLKGSGLNQFGNMIASAKAFQKCMVRRVFREVCKRETVDIDKQMVDKLAAGFKGGGYKLKDLFENVVIQPECTGN